jgi:hypothetical protein
MNTMAEWKAIGIEEAIRARVEHSSSPVKDTVNIVCTDYLSNDVGNEIPDIRRRRANSKQFRCSILPGSSVLISDHPIRMVVVYLWVYAPGIDTGQHVDIQRLGRCHELSEKISVSQEARSIDRELGRIERVAGAGVDDESVDMHSAQHICPPGDIRSVWIYLPKAYLGPTLAP